MLDYVCHVTINKSRRLWRENLNICNICDVAMGDISLHH